MTEPHYNPADVIAAADRLDVSMSELKDEIREQHVYGRRNRHLIWGLAASICLDLALSICLLLVFLRVDTTADLAAQNQQTQRTTCESGNQTRAASRDLWNYILDGVQREPKNQTPEIHSKIVEIRTYMQHAYADRDCSAIGE
jgi:hypothetical protein